MQDEIEMRRHEWAAARDRTNALKEKLEQAVAEEKAAWFKLEAARRRQFLNKHGD